MKIINQSCSYVIYLLFIAGFILSIGISATAQKKDSTKTRIDPVPYSASSYKVRETPALARLLKKIDSHAISIDANGKVVYNAKMRHDTVLYYASAYFRKGHGSYASYPGGDEGFIRFLQANMRAVSNLRVAAKNDTANIIATTHINFEIEKNGTISDVRFSSDVEHTTDVELVRVMKLSIWKPAIRDSLPVAGGYGLSIVYVKR